MQVKQMNEIAGIDRRDSNAVFHTKSINYTKKRRFDDACTGAFYKPACQTIVQPESPVYVC